MKVYIASGWQNPHVNAVKQIVTELEHTYYHFLESGYELDYNNLMPGLREQPAEKQAEYIWRPSVVTSMNVNLKAVRECDLLLILEPASKGSYTELGFASALGKRTMLLITPEYTLGVMDAIVDHVVHSLEQLREELS